MKFLLTEEEYDKLKNSKQELEEKYNNIIGDLCMKVADNMPVILPWSDIRSSEKGPWGCIHHKDYEWYCDNCPVLDVCPLPKNFSK